MSYFNETDAPDWEALQREADQIRKACRSAPPKSVIPGVKFISLGECICR